MLQFIFGIHRLISIKLSILEFFEILNKMCHRNCEIQTDGFSIAKKLNNFIK